MKWRTGPSTFAAIHTHPILSSKSMRQGPGRLGFAPPLLLEQNEPFTSPRRRNLKHQSSTIISMIHPLPVLLSHAHVAQFHSLSPLDPNFNPAVPPICLRSALVNVADGEMWMEEMLEAKVMFGSKRAKVFRLFSSSSSYMSPPNERYRTSTMPISARLLQIAESANWTRQR
ncbi:hypothetical protein BT69DRAFT_325485 [Atractiella rhizophila]|nr:hypothetical protein BT69DRAFT_325485 [Atractiella rhizophila]